jgi:lipopolysaccharide/colanic/teichoic acid biosynthesis glycosyltransferase
MNPASYTTTGATSHSRTAPAGSRIPHGSPAGSSFSPAGGHTVAIGPEGPLAQFFRRAVDIILSSIALLLLTPAFILIAVAIKVTSPGPVLYRQTRVGLNRRWGARRASAEPSGRADRRTRSRRNVRGHGQPFEIVKFRTMVVNAEAYGPQWSSEDDPRITPIGKFLRMTRLDEVPQFWNVLCGDMTIIGPRPERPYFVDQFVESVPNYADRLRARPGITGQAQVTLDYDASVEDVKRKLEADVDYLRNRGLARDMGILLRTVGVVVTGKGAR